LLSIIAERVPVAEVSRQAREVRFGVTVVAAVTGVLFGIGWLIAKLFAVAWLALAWTATAVRLGAQHAQAHQKPSRALIAQENANLLSEIEHLRAEVKRLTGG
jgi:NAD(P)-dependent dehydrogenase (short-subunit alcohol dehydrogenase family)